MRGFGDHRTFRALREQGVRGSSGPLTVVHLADRPGGTADPAGPRAAFAIGRKVGSAVVRNRARRRLRHLLADLDRCGRLAPGAYLVVVRPGVDAMTYAELGRHLARALERIDEKNRP